MTMESTEAGRPVGLGSTEGLGPLREAVNELMHHQFTHSRPAMHALQVLIDEATDAADEIDRLRAALLDARDCVEAWGAYASPYFQQKHGLLDDIERFDAVLRA
jgi:hypothetical protein